MKTGNFKQALSASIHNRRTLRNLKFELELVPFRLLGQQWASGRRWSEHDEDSVLVELVVPKLLHGFYVDVGANLPSRRSNTFRLYCHGMSGICVEPNLELASLLERRRRRDLVICAAVGERDSVATFSRFNYHVFSTCSVVNQRLVEAPKTRFKLDCSVGQ